MVLVAVAHRMDKGWGVVDARGRIRLALCGDIFVSM